MNRKKIFTLALALFTTLTISDTSALAMDNRHPQPAGKTIVHTDRNGKTASVPANSVEKFPQETSGKWDKRALQKLDPAEAEAFHIPQLLSSTENEQTTILGPAAATRNQMVHMIESRNRKPLLNCSVKELVQIYYEEAGREGIRPDIALCQAIKETGSFAYGGDVLPEQNNFCGLGATGNHVRGAVFATPRLGARAHIQHLLAYASEGLPSTPIEDPRYEHIVINRPDIHGKLQRWIDLNGVWAVPGTYYGQDILKLWMEARNPDGSDSSLQAAEKMIRQAPKDASSHIYRGAVYYAQKNFWLARVDFEAAAELSPQSPAAYYDLALALEAIDKKDKALEAYNQLLSVDPDFWQGRFNRGKILMSQGKYKEAIRDFEETLIRNPQMADAQNDIGVALLKMKKYDDAWNAFYRAHELNNRNPLPIKNLEQMLECMKK